MTLRLSPADIEALTGGLTQPRRQLAKLHERGFWRAWLGMDGQVVLEREHYRAVCRGALPPGSAQADTGARPQLRSVRSAA